MADEGERIICVSLVATTIMLLQHGATLAYRAPHCTQSYVCMCYVANCLRADVANICFSRRVQVQYSLWQSLNRSNWFPSLPQALAMASAPSTSPSPSLSLSLSVCLSLSRALKLVQKALVAAIDNPQSPSPSQPQLLQLPRLECGNYTTTTRASTRDHAYYI